MANKLEGQISQNFQSGNIAKNNIFSEQQQVQMSTQKHIKQQGKEIYCHFLPWFKGIIFKILRVLTVLNIGLEFRSEYLIISLSK